MQKKLNEDFIDSYCEKFAAEVTSTFFTEDKETISGKEILSITPSKQANFFVVKLIFRYWQAESKKLESPFFNYKHTDVKEALIEFMNVLSQHIEVHKNNFQLLLNHAVKDTIYLAAAPEAYIEIDLEARGVDTISEKAITGTLKYVRLYKKEIEDFLSDMKDLTIDDVIDEVAEQFNDFDSTPGLEQELAALSEILPIKIDQVVTDDIPDDFDDEDDEVFDNDDDFFAPRKETAVAKEEEKPSEEEEATEPESVEDKALEKEEVDKEEEEEKLEVKDEEVEQVEEIEEESSAETVDGAGNEETEIDEAEKEEESQTAEEPKKQERPPLVEVDEDDEGDDEDDFFTPEKESFKAIDDDDDDEVWDNDDDFFTPRKATSDEGEAPEETKEEITASDKIDWDDKEAKEVDEAGLKEDAMKVESVFTGESPEKVEEMEEEISEDDTPEVIPKSDDPTGEEEQTEQQPETVNDQFESEAETVAEHHEKAKESSMMKLISVNHQYMFVKELFKDDQVSFQNALYELEEQTSFDGAVEYLVQSYAREFEWDMQSTEVKELLKVLFRKFRD